MLVYLSNSVLTRWGLRCQRNPTLLDALVPSMYLKPEKRSKTPTFEAKSAASVSRTSISVLGNDAIPSVSFHCGMKPLVQLAEDFEILGQRIPYFSGFSPSS
ncbi:hypothetical protein Y032_0202g1793 [Ancylostoma ceylanicum]|uniref:Uncharacterized protein n=1 Tax=Ancylostoma ceylanicum TaxID=53326 RepID=A0A016SM60_9BILA|nr:hypothetical protein Y032_0202g1793 [Ancylostoma ceylanicum]